MRLLISYICKYNHDTLQTTKLRIHFHNERSFRITKKMQIVIYILNNYPNYTYYDYNLAYGKLLTYNNGRFIYTTYNIYNRQSYHLDIFASI